MPEPPILLSKWYDYAKWIIERVDSFPKNQRFIFGQRLAGHALDIMEILTVWYLPPMPTTLDPGKLRPVLHAKIDEMDGETLAILHLDQLAGRLVSAIGVMVRLGSGDIS